MTSPEQLPTQPADPLVGDSLRGWLAAHHRLLVDAALAALADPSDPDPERMTQLRWICDYNVALFLRMLDGVRIDEAEASALVASAAERASEGRPIETLLRDYVTGTGAMWRAAAEALPAGRPADLLDLTSAIHAYLGEVVGLVARGFEREQERVGAMARDARFAAYTALLSGSADHDMARRAGFTLAPRYLVVSLRLGSLTTASATDSGRLARPSVEEHRRANTVQRLLAERAHGLALSLMSGSTGTGLVPLPASAVEDERLMAQALAASLASTLGCSAHLATAIVDLWDVPAAVAQTEEVLELVLATGRPSGAWFLDDVLVDYQLTQPGPARDHLAARLRPLRERADWLETVRAYAGHGFDRRRTAEALHVHPNTVDYRLGRVAEVCGWDPSDASDRLTVVAALAVLDLETAQRP